MWYQILILAVLLILSALFSGSEIAFMSVTPSKVKELYSKRKPGAKTLKKLKENPHRLLIAILVGNNIVNVGASAYTAVTLTEYFGDSSIGITTGLITFLVLIFGEITPKSFAHSHAAGIALVLAKPFLLLEYALFPVVIVFEQVVKFVNWVSGTKKDITVSEDELMAMVRLGAEEGAIEKHERDLIENVLEFNDITVKEVMVPRVEVQALSEEQTLEEAADMVEEYGHSRIPIYRRDLDHVVGILNMRDLFQYIRDFKKSKKLKTLDFDPLIKVPFSKKINVLFREFQKKHIHMAVVIDEYGGTAGIISLEDILEEIVGEIEDEFDEEDKPVEIVNANTIIVMGDTLVEEIDEAFKEKVFGKSKDSMNAYILKTLGRFPREKEVIKIKNLRISILSVGDNAVEKVRVTRKG
ncbi:HlyC/CorC family transporter [Candidatus Peregrinibacteria bacterium]|jgi:putative hemolysin|nr:HlyC/CorC family transporter [Candidatus Peregrinibacteria bacterium]